MLLNYQLGGNKIPGIFEGKVVGYDNDVYMGIKIWVPGLHDEKYLTDEKIKELPTAHGAAPLFGNCDGESGMFSCPEIGTLVYCFCIDGDPNSIVYFAADYEKSIKSKKSYPVIKMNYSEKDCVWLKQGPGQIVLRSPSKMMPADSENSDSENSEPSTDGTRIKVVEIFSGNNVSSDDDIAASICIFSNNDIEIKGQNVTISASKSINLEVNEKLKADSKTDTNDALNKMSEQEASSFESSEKITMGSDRIDIEANNIDFHTKFFNLVTSLFSTTYFEHMFTPLFKAISSFRTARKVDQLKSSKN